MIEATGVDAEGVSRSVLLEMARKTQLPRAAVVAAIEADEWLCNSFDLSRLNLGRFYRHHQT